MNSRTFFKTPRGSNNKWYYYILFFFLMVLLGSVLSLPIYFIKVIPDTYLSYFKDLAPSALLFLSIVWVLKWLHHRSAYTLINANRIRWRRILWAMGCFGAITLFFELATYLYNPALYLFSFNKSTFLQYMIISLVLIPFQAAAEELLMRGYFLQGVTWATKRPWVAIVLTAVFFWILHLDNPEIEAFGWPFVLSYIIMGTAAGIMTVLDDGAELAIGVHIINNLYCAIAVSFKASVLQTNTLFFVNDYNATYWAIIGLVSFLVFLFLSHRKFGWGSFKTLFEKLED